MATAAKTTTSAPSTFVFRSWPKMVFLWPTTLACIAMGLATQFNPENQILWGSLFMTVLGVNLLVLTFDFPRTTSLTFTAMIIAVVLGLILLNQYVKIFPALEQFFSSLKISASPHFYYVLFAVMLLLFAGMYFITRFDYWELSSNELIHHKGFLGDVERFTTAGLKLNSELTDVFEYALWGSGTIVMSPQGSPRPIVLDNVPSIKKVTRRVDEILEARKVRFEPVAQASAAPTMTDEVEG
ncbi:hypothetical protein K2X85_04285 [bacterium]|jgi:hypothetical protein|nr:hypothetical protein [bacterium]